MNSTRIGKTVVTAMLVLGMIAAIVSPAFAAASTSSQVVRNAQAMYDKITETYGSFHGYIPVFSNQRLSYQQTLNQAEFYNEVHDTSHRTTTSSGGLNVGPSRANNTRAH